MGYFPLADTMRFISHPSVTGATARGSWRRLRGIGWWRPDPPDPIAANTSLSSFDHHSHVHSRFCSSNPSPKAVGGFCGIRRTAVARTQEWRVVATVERGPPTASFEPLVT
jgi:hypothetical protein